MRPEKRLQTLDLVSLVPQHAGGAEGESRTSVKTTAAATQAEGCRPALGLDGDEMPARVEERQVRAPQLEASEIMEQKRLTLAEVRAAWLGGTFKNLGTLGAVGLALAVLENDP